MNHSSSSSGTELMNEGNAPHPHQMVRRLLTRLRNLMQGEGEDQKRLDDLTLAVAEELHAEVCSLYLVRLDGRLELYSTHGLKPAAVHRTVLARGEGIVGEIAETGLPLALYDARKHPSFSYHPETGEEAFQSLVGVPIRQSFLTSGVLLVQHVTSRRYQSFEVEALETVALLVSELFHTLISHLESPAESRMFEGKSIVGGYAVGQATFLRRSPVLMRVAADTPEEECRRLDNAMERLEEQLTRMKMKVALSSERTEEREADHPDDKESQNKEEQRGETTYELIEASHDILDTFLMIVRDPGWKRRILSQINLGLTADAAILRALEELRSRMLDADTPELRERIWDLEGLSFRLIDCLEGRNAQDILDFGAEKDARGEKFVLVARNLSPLELLNLDHKRIAGIVLEEGSAFSHVAVIARTLNFPVVGRLKEITRYLPQGERVAINGTSGQVWIKPSESTLRQLAEADEYSVAVRESPEELALRPVTKDSIAFDVFVNAGLASDLKNCAGSQGCGLFRTEIPFMLQSSWPVVELQTKLYAEVLDAAGTKPVVFRTLDIGCDKPLPYFRTPKEVNPALGWRSLRITLDRPWLVRAQFRAIFRASQGRDLSIMLPMVTHSDEFFRTRDLLIQEKEMVMEKGYSIGKVDVGVMLEVPSLAFELPSLLEEIDFVSVGTNDLSQFFFAWDRGHAVLSDRYDPVSWPMFYFLKMVQESCAAAGKPITCCGEIAADPEGIMMLVALGVRRLSVAPPSVVRVRSVIKSMQAGLVVDRIEAMGAKMSESGKEGGLRSLLKEMAIEQGIPI